MDSLSFPLPNLRLFLCPAERVDVRDYEVYASREVGWEGGRLYCHVIGASSIVIVEAGGTALAEVIACVDREPCSSLAMVKPGASPGSCARVSLFGEQMGYGALVSTRRIDDPPDGAPFPHALVHHFPGPGRPRTEIRWQIGPERIAVRTVHEYPECGLAVHSVSYWFPSGLALPAADRMAAETT